MINIDDFRMFLVIKRGLDDNSIRLVLGRLTIFIDYCIAEKQEICKVSVENFLYSLKLRKLKPNSINAYIFMLKQLRFYCVDRGIIPEDFSDGVKHLPHPPPPIIVLTQQEVDALIDCVVPYKRFRNYSGEYITEQLNGLYKIFTRFLSRTGARFEEAAGLTCKYVDLWEGKVTFTDTKNGDYRSVYIMEPLISELREAVHGKKPEELVFTSFLGSKIIPQNYALHTRRAAKQLGITKRVHPHIFRHSFATQLYLATKDIGLVQVVLGHKDIKSTMIYIHLADEAVRKGLYRHPYNRSAISGEEFVKIIEDDLSGYHLHEYQQFDQEKVRAAVNRFREDLHGSIQSSCS